MANGARIALVVYLGGQKSNAVAISEHFEVPINVSLGGGRASIIRTLPDRKAPGCPETQQVNIHLRSTHKLGRAMPQRQAARSESTFELNTADRVVLKRVVTSTAPTKKTWPLRLEPASRCPPVQPSVQQRERHARRNLPPQQAKIVNGYIRCTLWSPSE